MATFEDLTPEQKAAAKACKTPEEMLGFVKEQGFELSDEQLESISGGDFWESKPCDSRCADDGICPTAFHA